jgi:hypothetical protein
MTTAFIWVISQVGSILVSGVISIGMIFAGCLGGITKKHDNHEVNKTSDQKHINAVAKPTPKGIFVLTDIDKIVLNDTKQTKHGLIDLSAITDPTFCHKGITNNYINGSHIEINHEEDISFTLKVNAKGKLEWFTNGKSEELRTCKRKDNIAICIKFKNNADHQSEQIVKAQFTPRHGAPIIQIFSVIVNPNSYL